MSGRPRSPDGPPQFGPVRVSLPQGSARLESGSSRTVITVEGRADLRGVTLGNIVVDVEHEQGKLVDGPGDTTERERKTRGSRRRLTVTSDLAVSQVARLPWAAANHPVPNPCEQAVEIRTMIGHRS